MDWHDFVVVETIDFYNEEDDSLPSPLSLPEVIAQLRTARLEEAAPAGEDAAMEVEMDEEERLMVQGAQEAPLPAAPLEAPEPQMKIVRNYKRPGAPGSAAGVQQVVSPITGELVPVDQMAEHMRISLIDPKWKVQREAMMGKLRGSTVATDEEISRNVISLARTRPDIFGSSAEEVSAVMSAELERQKGAAGPPPPGAAAPPPGYFQELQQQQRPPPPPMQAPPPMPWAGHMAPPGYPPLGSLPPGFPGAPFPGHLPPPGMYGLPPPGVMPPPLPLQPGFPGGPLYPPPLPPPPFGEEPDAKRQRTDQLLSEEDFAEAHPGPLSVHVTVPEVEGEAGLRGQTVTLEVSSVMETIGDVKARLAAAVGVPASKQKVSSLALGFLKDTSTLAAYNFGAGTALQLGLKVRGKK